MGMFARGVRARWGRIFAIVVVLSIALGTNVTSFSGGTAQAADLSQFDAGNIISDSIFFSGDALSESQVQAFLNQKVPNCTINNGDPSHAAGAGYGSTNIADVCLKDYWQRTPSMAAQSGACAAYSGASGGESAASIIAKVGQACNVSQKVLLVLLEKEQSLITDSWPTVRQINQATGFACYDNGQPCVQDYAGFFYQVWSAARQFQRYSSAPFTWYPVGQTSNVAYQANRPDCGTKAVFISNRATAALYYYTPYTPNAAALAAGYGTGDSCSAYGNRNFYQLYVDWFGSSKGFSVASTFYDQYTATGGGNGFLGSPTGTYSCGLVAGGCYQTFQGGYIFTSPATGTHAVRPEVRNVWGSYRAENGQLGYPTSDPSNNTNTYTQTFQGGTVTVTNGTARLTAATDPWLNAVVTSDWLGTATSNKSCGLKDGGCYQIFQGGYIFTSPASGTHSVRNEVRALWYTYRAENGQLGYPTSDPSNNTNTYTQTFQGGTVTVTNGTARLG